VAIDGWILDKSAVARSRDAGVMAQLEELAGVLWICPVGELEQLYSTRSAVDYDALAAELRGTGATYAAVTHQLLQRADRARATGEQTLSSLTQTDSERVAARSLLDSLQQGITRLHGVAP